MPTYEIMVSLNKQIKVEAKDEEDAKDKMSLNREPTKFEEKVNFKELDEEMQFINMSLKEDLTPILIGWRDDILKKVK